MPRAQTDLPPDRTSPAAGAPGPARDKYVRPGSDAPFSAASCEIAHSDQPASWNWTAPLQNALPRRQRQAPGQNPAGSPPARHAGSPSSALGLRRSPGRSSDIATRPGPPTPRPARAPLPIEEGALWSVVWSFNTLLRQVPERNPGHLLIHYRFRLPLKVDRKPGGPQWPLQQGA